MTIRRWALYEGAPIAATALALRLTMLVRKFADFTESGAPLPNPFLPSDA